jgi:hypothetical protein
MKYRAKVTIWFDVTIPGNHDEYRHDEVEMEIMELTDRMAYDSLHNNAVAGPTATDVELKPVPAKRSSKRRR